MPELPEVETVRRGLAPALEGHILRRVALRRKDLRFPFPPRLAERLTGRRITAVSRRAKYLLWHLDDGQTLIVHLGMTGRFTLFPPGAVSKNLGEFYYESGAAPHGPGTHDHVAIELDDGTRVIYTDPRRFGVMDLWPSRDLANHRLLAGLGMEPLDDNFSGDVLAETFKGKKAPLKAALLDQRIVAGLGNIYVCEALHRAGLSPRRLAGTMTHRTRRPQLDRLADEVKKVLTEAIAAGGSTLRDYAQADGTSGAFQQHFAVYAREGEYCLRPGCSGIIQRILQSGRSTFFCPRCQK
jgi:formamidopyrimidine-DNA glycosylase